MTRRIPPIRPIRPLHAAISALIILVALTFIFSTLAVVKVYSQTTALQDESTARTSQFCHLVNSTHTDRVARFEHTLEYLRSPAGHERTLFNEYIRRVSLPQSRQEIVQEAKAIPPICKAVR